MDTTPINAFLNETTSCNYTSIQPASLDSFAYNGITYAQGYETYQKTLNTQFNMFKSCILEIATINKDLLPGILADYKKAQDETYYDIPDNDYIKQMEREAETNDNQSLRQSIREAYFLNKMVGVQKWFLQAAITYIEGFMGEAKEKPKPKPITVKTEPESRLNKILSDYGDLLSVNDLTTIFGCTSRTISNWEKEGIIKNVAPKSEEINSVGRKKRGQEKRYRKDAIIRSAILQEKINELH